MSLAVFSKRLLPSKNRARLFDSVIDAKPPDRAGMGEMGPQTEGQVPLERGEVILSLPSLPTAHAAVPEAAVPVRYGATRGGHPG